MKYVSSWASTAFAGRSTARTRPPCRLRLQRRPIVRNGVVFGWLFWRYCFEAAFVAHVFAHVVAVSTWLVALLV